MSSLRLLGALTYWEIDLTNGEKAVARAHGFSHEGGAYVLSAFVEDETGAEIDLELLRLPESVVQDVFGGTREPPV